MMETHRRLSIIEEKGEEGAVEVIDLETLDQDPLNDREASNSESHTLPTSKPTSSPANLTFISVLQVIFGYESPDPHNAPRPTAWLDGVRGLAALAVYIFHLSGAWTWLVPAWGATTEATNVMQLPLIRTIFVSGGAAVSVFFVLSGYVLTYSSLAKIRAGHEKRVYPAVASSAFRRGFRLYLPVVALTFAECVSTIFGFAPPLNFDFVPEPNAWCQLWDWIKETNRLINPFLDWERPIHGFVTHPKYDAVVWTIPLEFWGSMMCYILLLILTQIPVPGIRMGLLGVCAVGFMSLGSWNMFCFASGVLIADLNLGQMEDEPLSPLSLSRPVSKLQVRNLKPLWIVILVAGFYVAGFPTLSYHEEWERSMLGFETLRSLIPVSVDFEDHARFWWSISGVGMLLSISQLSTMKRFFSRPILQYLGKISFSLYLVHEFCVELFGLKLQIFMQDFVGVEPKSGTIGYWLLAPVWVVAFSCCVFPIAAMVERWIDVPSVKFAKWFEERSLKWVKSLRPVGYEFVERREY